MDRNQILAVIKSCGGCEVSGGTAVYSFDAVSGDTDVKYEAASKAAKILNEQGLHVICQGAYVFHRG